MFHLGAFYESKDQAGAFLAINAVREEMIFTNGVDYRIPEGLAHIVGGAIMVNHATVVRGQFAAPSLRMHANLDIEPLVISAAVFGSPPEVLFHPMSAIPLTPDEALNCFIEATPGGAVAQYGLVWLSDGPQEHVTGDIISIRATSTVQQVAGAWVNGNLAFAQTLPAGRYQVIGFRCRSTDGVAARLVFPAQVNRPGVAVVNALGDLDPTPFRYGRFGSFGEFPHTIPPTLDILGGVAAAQVSILDLLKVG